MPIPAGELQTSLLAPLAGTITGSGTATPTLTPTSSSPVSAFRVKRLGSSVGDLRWSYSTDTVDATHGYLLTDLDPDSGWVFAQTAALLLYASGGAVDYEIMRLS